MTTADVSTELLPCPFCGGNLRLDTADVVHRWRHPYSSEEEANCIFRSMTGIENWPEPDSDRIAAWNTRSLRNAQSEAVAWGKPAHPSAAEPFFIFDTDRVHDWQKAVFTVPLYTHPAPQSEAVAVKALEWEPKGGTHGIYAEDGFGGLYFAYDDGAWSSPRKSFPAPLDGSGSIETAKVAAQADYAHTHPAPPLAVTDEMVERLARHMWDGDRIIGWDAAVQVAAQEPTSSYHETLALFRNKALVALTAALEAKQ